MDALFGLPAIQALALDVAHEQRLHGATLFQTVKMLGRERIEPCGGERFTGIARVLGHHQFLSAVLAPLVVIPVHLLECASPFPQFAFVLVHLFPQCLRVIHGKRVDVYLVPWHKHGLLVTEA